MSDGLLDFGTGLFSGGLVGAKVSGGNPIATVAGGLGLGAISYFGGAADRRTERSYNKKTLAQMDQDMQFGELKISEARRAKAQDIERQKRKEMFGQMLAQYFQRQGNK